MKDFIDKAYICIVCLLCIFATSSVIGYQFHMITFMEIFMIAANVLFAFYKGVSVEDLGKIYFILLVFFPISFIQLFIHNVNFAEWIRIPLLILSFSLFGSACKKTNFDVVEIFYSVFYAIAVVSLILYIVVEIVQLNIPYSLTKVEWLPTYKCYLFIYYSRIDLLPDYLGPIQIVRNTGIFTEPGLFAVFLVMVLYIHLVILKKNNKFKLNIILASILTTVSTTGFTLSIIILCYHFVSNARSQVKNFILPLFPLILGGVGIVFQEILNLKAENHFFSYYARTTDLVKGFQLFLEKPLFGWGYENKEAYYNLIGSLFYSIRANSNGLVSALYQLGLFGISFYIIPLVMYYREFINMRPQKEKNLALGIIVMIMIVIGEPIQFSAITMMILGLLYAGYTIDKEYANEKNNL